MPVVRFNEIMAKFDLGGDERDFNGANLDKLDSEQWWVYVRISA